MKVLVHDCGHVVHIGEELLEVDSDRPARFVGFTANSNSFIDTLIKIGEKEWLLRNPAEVYNCTIMEVPDES